MKTNQSGYTLVELICVIALFGITIAITVLYVLFHFLSKFW